MKLITDKDKARADGEALADRINKEKTDLARELRAWRGDMTMKEAAKLLGMSWRTLEGIEHGRGFSYSTILKIAMEEIAMKAKKGGDNA